ncbi:cobra-like protein 1 [Phtheirospermum japonicum]|uniref:COBRA-like protein n=1 Tax=Phtheirospermum japonicum TaxID=374723 RepID=A0A830CHP9_9LAMI|nr:cobra-like protein 1 [Phtheirospermum japonicum]
MGFIIHLTCNADAYEPLDPNGNITVRWDVLQENEDGSQDVKISIVNNQLFRHVDHPGWKLSWAWPGEEVIWSMLGAEAKYQGKCEKFKGKVRPHCCEKEPVIIDLLPGTPYNTQVSNCCRGGVLSSMLQDPGKSLAAFQMHIGSASSNASSAPGVPVNFTLGVPGYTCGPAQSVSPTTFYEDHGRRRTEAFATRNVTCYYSQFRASPVPTCCVSMSAFYSETIVPCPQCSCACQGQPGSTCLSRSGESAPVLQLQHDEQPKPLVQCTRHMCPIQVHWHVKQQYTQYWRVKITITNHNFAQNYTDWNLVALHPNLKNITQIFSFNYKPFEIFRDTNDTGMFYGIQHYNDMLLQSGKDGNAQSEMLLKKVPGFFTLRNGWAFPRKISFNGQQCVMPLPDDYPRLPNSGHFQHASLILLLSLLVLLVLLF